jgi:hypothetical protein
VSQRRRPSSRVTFASSIPKKRPRWLWKGRLALGYLAVWCGPGDIGKSMFAAWVAKCVTRGELDGDFYGIPQGVLIISTEDDRADAWKPRLEAVCADCSRVAFLDYPAGWNVRDGIGWLDGALAEITGGGLGVPLAFIDAMMSHMPESGGGQNTRSPTFVRGALGPLAEMCRRRSLTGLFSLHPRKAGGETFADVVQEAGAFTQLPRMGLLFGYHPDDRELPQPQQRRVIIRSKGNLGRDPGGLSFRIDERALDWGDDDPNGVAEPVGYITDVQPCSVTERQLLGNERAGDNDLHFSRRALAKELILVALLDGEWHPAEPIRKRLAAVGVNHDATVVWATKQLGVEKDKRGYQGAWHWRIPLLRQEG